MTQSTKKTFFVTSAPVACGVTWLVNALIECGIKGTSLVYKDDNWVKKEDEWAIGESSRVHMVNHLPTVANRDKFKFREDIEFFWEHRLSFPADKTCPVVVVMRDPRDAIFSLYRRWKGNGWIDLSFQEFLSRPSDWPDHFPGLFHTDPVKMYVMYHLTWLAQRKFRPVLFVQFEKLKTSPMEELRKIFGFLKMDVPSEETLRAAVMSSTFSGKKVAVPEGQNFGALFKGEVFEWKKNYEPLALERFERSGVQKGLEPFGYSEIPVERDEVVFKNPTLVQRLFDYGLSKWGLDKFKVQYDRLKRFLVRIGSDESRYDDFVEVLLAADSWATLVHGSAVRERNDLRRFFVKAIRELLEPQEISLIVDRTRSDTGDWSEAALQVQLSRFEKLNALNA